MQLRDGVGIVTDRDLRSRVVAAGVQTGAPVSEVMSAPAYTVAHDRLGTDVLLEMLDRGVRHFPVLSATGDVLGVIADNDLLAAEARTPFQLRRAVGAAETPDAVATAARGLPQLVVALHDANVAPETIGRMMTVDRRRGDEAADRARPRRAGASRPCRSAGSRSAAPRAASWRRRPTSTAPSRGTATTGTRSCGGAARLAAEVIDGLTACGSPPCGNGAVASSPLFSRSFDAWRSAAAGWLADPEQDRAVILVSVAIDGRPVFGVREGLALAQSFTRRAPPSEAVRRMARLALGHRPPTGFLRDFVVEHSGEHAGRLDIKRGGLLPVMDIARYAGMEAGVAGRHARRG